MTLKQRAIVQTAGIVAAVVTSSVAVTLILEQLTAQQIVSGFALLSMGALVYAIYGVVLSRLEYAATLKSLVDSQAK
jgi:uncharacterized membrane protein